MCDIARDTVLREAAAAGVPVDETDISGDEGLTRQYGEEIPVVLIDGRVHTFWKVDAARFAAALRASK